MKPLAFSRILLILLALLLPVIPGAAPIQQRELQWENRDGIWMFTLHFDHVPVIQTTDQHVEMGYFYLDCANENGPAGQVDWPFKAPQITQVRRVYYGRQRVLRYIFYVPRGSQVRIDSSLADARTCVVTISPLVAAALEPRSAGADGHPRKMVVIDPGHGGWATRPGFQEGAQTARRYNGQYYHEKDITLKIAQYLERYVKQSPNLEAFMTRREDVYVSLDRRIELANQARGDLFLSIHLNATGNRSSSARGFEIYYLTGEDRAVNRQLVAMENEEKVELDTRDSSGETLRELLRILANEKFPQVQAASRDLCTVINDEFRGSGPFRGHNRGVKAEAFRVLLNFNMPAALAECGFLNNDDDARVLIQPEGQQQVAALLFNGINRYFATVDPKFKPHMVQVAH